jgi:hypothetical protein
MTTMVFTDIATEIGVKSSARYALNRDFYHGIVSDAVSSSEKMHTLALYRIWRGFLWLHLQMRLWIYGIHVDHKSKELEVKDDSLLLYTRNTSQYDLVHYNKVKEGL